MTPKVVVLGAGFGGLELSTILSEAFTDGLDLTLIDQSDHFVFGFSKLDVMFGREPPDAVRLAYRHVVKPGVRFRQERITAIDPVARRVTTDAGTYDADVLVVALGADYDLDATPGLTEVGNEFYSVQGASRLREVLPTFSKGRAIVGVTSTPFKCPPAPSEAALLLHDYLTERGVRDACQISLVMPFGLPIPPSPAASRALLAAFAERDITFVPNRLVHALDPARRVAVLDDQSELAFDLFLVHVQATYSRLTPRVVLWNSPLPGGQTSPHSRRSISNMLLERALGIPKHRAPTVVEASGMAEGGWIPVNPTNLKTRFPGVYAIGDVTSVGTPKAGLFAEGAARVVAAALVAELQGGDEPAAYTGAGSCYIEFGANRVGRVDVDFLSGPSPTGNFHDPSAALVDEKEHFGASRRRRWFGL